MDWESKKSRLGDRVSQLILGAVAIFSAGTFANPIDLFKAGVPIKDYDKVVYNLQPQESVRFSDGAVFTIEKNYVPLAGNPNRGTTAIFSVGNGRVIRIPKRCSAKSQCETNQDYLVQFAKGEKLLREKGVLIPQVYLEESYLPEYVVVEELEIIELLYDWFTYLGDHPGDVHPLKLAALKKFAARASPFTHIGDFGDTQVALTPKGWVLFDWTDKHALYDPSPQAVAPLFARRGLPLFSNIRGRPNTKEVIDAMEVTMHSARAVENCNLRLEQSQNFQFTRPAKLQW